MSIDPELNYCQCGYTWKFKLYHKLLMLLFGDYSFKCPQCQAVMKFRLIHHTVKIKTESIKNKESIWRNG